MTLDQMPYTANAHPTRGRGGASHHDDGRLDVQGSSPDTPGSDTNPSGTAKCVRPRGSMITSAVSSSPPGRTLLATVAAAGAFGLVLLAAPCDPQTATKKETTVAQSETTTAAVRPFHINIPEEALVDLRRRINATKWPERETVTDASQGVQLATMQELARYWATEYDWRKCEAKPGVSGARIYWENKFRAISTPRMSPSRLP
jgi:Epoxide hydrolase N terminus